MLCILPLQVGTSFYLLLRGKVSVSSSKLADKSAGAIVLTDGACFGEAGLVARVRREATVTAIADCLMLQLDASDIEDLNIDLVEMRIHVISQVSCRGTQPSAHGHAGTGLDCARTAAARSRVASQILEKANFFRSLTRLQRDTLATIMDICYYPSEDIVFTEGELVRPQRSRTLPHLIPIWGVASAAALPQSIANATMDAIATRSQGTKFFIIIEGRVQMRKISPRSGNTVALAEYHTYDERPWFGELALWSTKPRAATAVCLEPTKLLVVNAQHLQTFLDIVPTFASMFDTSMVRQASAARHLLPPLPFARACALRLHRSNHKGVGCRGGSSQNSSARPTVAGRVRQGGELAARGGIEQRQHG